MATMSEPFAQPVSAMKRYHVFHAGAHKSLFTESVGETSVEGLISFQAGHTRVIGSQLTNKKDIWGNEHSGWVTQSTSVLEGFNVGDVITADRVVAQVSAEHPLTYPGHVPKVTFLGTRFENLQVAGYPVQLELNLGFCGNTPEGDRPYLEDIGFLDRVQGQLNSVEDKEHLPQVLKKQYDDTIADINSLKKLAKGGSSGGRTGNSKLQCSLIKSIAPIPIPGVKVFGNTIFIPNFGTVSLAEVEVGIEADDGGFSGESRDGASSEPSRSSYFTLRMLNMRLGCPLVGTTTAASTTVNGGTRP